MTAHRPPSRSQQLTGTLATLVNFPVVFAGLLAITVGTDGNDEIALLNLWALWGIAQGLLGQVAQVSGVLDGRAWTDPRALRMIPRTAGLVAVVAFLLSDTWFPDHETWWIATLFLSIAVVVIGRQRAVLIRRLDGTHALVVAALENSIRSASMVVLVLAAAEGDGLIGWGAVAIVGPFVVSMALLANRIEGGTASVSSGRAESTSPTRSISSGVLSGLPALAAYAIVPGLTLLDQTDDLGAIAIAASLLRGPLLVATFLAPVLLERWVVLKSSQVPRGLLLLPVALVGLQVLTSVVADTTSIGQLVAQTVIAGAIASLTYLLILRLLRTLSTSPTALWASALAAVVFAGVLVLSDVADWLHPFVSLGAACAAIVLVIARMNPADSLGLQS